MAMEGKKWVRQVVLGLDQTGEASSLPGVSSQHATGGAGARRGGGHTKLPGPALSNMYSKHFIRPVIKMFYKSMQK